MEHSDVCTRVKRFIGAEILQGHDVGLENHTPLLEWGIINSFETIRLKNFIRDEFGVALPNAEVTGQNLKTIDAIGHLVLKHHAKSQQSPLTS
jgi:acyl carrier protein